MTLIHAVAIAAFLVLGTAMKSGACPLMGNPTCTTVSDQEVLNSLQASNVNIHGESKEMPCLRELATGSIFH